VSQARFDVVVAGAGPAGSAAALVLARAGARVALADKSAFPRDKACGDLIGPRGVQALAELGVDVPEAGRGSDLLAIGPSGRRVRLPAYPGRRYAGHGIICPRLQFDDALRAAAIAAGAVPVRARISAADTGPGGQVRALLAADGQRLGGDVIIGADGALSPVAQLAGMLGQDRALWGFAIRAYLPAEVPMPLLVLLDRQPWRIYPGYGWLFPGDGGQANVGIGVGLGTARRSTALRADLARFCERLRGWGDLAAGAGHGPVTGGWLRMGGTGAPLAAGNVLLAGDAAGLINPLQGEGIAEALISGRLAAEAVIAGPGRAGPAYAGAVAAAFGPYLAGAAALQSAMLARPRLTSAGVRLLTAPVVSRMLAGTWSVYWNGLADGARPRPAAWAAAAVQGLAGLVARSGPGPVPEVAAAPEAAQDGPAAEATAGRARA
jgi:geranylgeranyl reductase family protein